MTEKNPRLKQEEETPSPLLWLSHVIYMYIDIFPHTLSVASLLKYSPNLGVQFHFILFHFIPPLKSTVHP